MSFDVKASYPSTTPANYGLHVQSNEDRLIIPFVSNQFKLSHFPEEKIGRRISKAKLEGLLAEIARQIQQKKEKSREKWRLFVALLVLIILTVITFIVMVLAYGGGETELPSVEAGKKSVASVIVILVMIMGVGWIYSGAKESREHSRITFLLDDMNKRRGLKKHNLFLKFGDHMKWLEFYFDYRKYKMMEQKKLDEANSLISGNINKGKNASPRKSKRVSSISHRKKEVEDLAVEDFPKKFDPLNESTTANPGAFLHPSTYGKLPDSSFDSSMASSNEIKRVRKSKFE